MQLACKTSGLTKTFKTFTAVDHLNLEIPEGVIFGLLGPNGAGKTTTLRMLTGLAKPTSGEIELMGKTQTFGGGNGGVIGFLPDVPQFYPYMTALEFLVLCGQVSGMKESAAKKQGKELLDMVSLHTKNKKTGSFSRGMKQRLGLAQALMGSPKILLMDEPVSALDPLGRAEVLKIIESLKGKITVIFSSHILSDAERVCEYAAIIKEGKLVLSGKLTDIKQKYTLNRYHLKPAYSDDRAVLTGKLKELPGVANVTASEADITFSAEAAFNTAEIVKLLAAHEYGLSEFYRDEPSLEDIFLKVVSA